MTFSLFKPKRVSVPSADALQLSAEAFVQDLIERSTPEQIRRLELATRNGTLTVEIQIAPEPAISIHVDPGKTISINIESKS
jgi:hypothetical protein